MIYNLSVDSKPAIPQTVGEKEHACKKANLLPMESPGNRNNPGRSSARYNNLGIEMSWLCSLGNILFLSMIILL